jgi:hypothetical protein
MTTTIVTWNEAIQDSETGAAILAQAAQMAADGKTDNVPIRETIGTEQVTTRTWTTLADAEEWIAFVEQYTPMSATIQT